MTWELTEDEIVAEASKDSTYCQLSVDIGMWAAREAQKKLIEWGEQPCKEHPIAMINGETHFSCIQCRQALKKQLGVK